MSDQKVTEQDIEKCEAAIAKIQEIMDGKDVRAIVIVIEDGVIRATDLRINAAEVLMTLETLAFDIKFDARARHLARQGALANLIDAVAAVKASEAK